MDEQTNNQIRKKLRKPSEKKKRVKNTTPLHKASACFPLLTPDGLPTFAGVSRYLWKDIRDYRRLSVETAERYERILDTVVLKAFDDRAFSQLTEEDILKAWSYISNQDYPESTKKTVSLIIRQVLELAYERGLTQILLWGIPQDIEFLPRVDSEGVLLNPRILDEREGQRLARQAFKAKSISLDAELALAKILLDATEYHGEAIAALLMLCNGVRTSEACGFSYEHLQWVVDDLWCLVRYEVNKADSRTVVPGGKSKNAFRILPIFHFLKEMLLRRRAYLEERFPGQNIDKFPLACSGTDYSIRCNQREVNRILKAAYREAGVAEELMMLAYYAVKEDKDMPEEPELEATAYLCRKHVATTLKYCGLTEVEICIVMGHAIVTRNVQRADYSNPDKLRELARKLSRRPLAQIFDNLPEYNRYTFCNGTMLFRDDRSVEITFLEEQHVKVCVSSEAPCDDTVVTVEGIQWDRVSSAVFPKPLTQESTSLYRILGRLAQESWERVKAHRYCLHLPEAMIDRIDWTEVLKEQEGNIAVTVDYQGHPDKEERDVVIVSTHRKKEPLGAGKQIQMIEGEKARPENVTEKTISSRYAVNSATLYAIDEDGLIEEVSNPQKINSRDKVGPWLFENQKKPIQRLFACSLGYPAWILSPDGMLFRVPENQKLDATFCVENKDAYWALRRGGILLQNPMVEETGGALVCLADSGRIRKISLCHLQRLSKSGRMLVSLQTNERIVSACLCGENCEVLLVSEKGKALRLSATEFRAVTTLGTSLYAGIALKNGDKAVACMPYQEGKEYILIKRSGMALRTDRDFRIMPHGRNSGGVAIAKVPSSDAVLSVTCPSDALLVVNNKGRCLCLDANDVVTVKNEALGVLTMRLKPGERVVSAVNMQLLPENLSETSTPNEGDESRRDA